MQDRATVQHKLRQVIFRHLQYLLRQALRPRPQTCSNNVGRTLQPGVEIRLCKCLETETPTPYDQVCDIRLGGVEKAKTCEFWRPLKSKGALRQEFQAKMDRLIKAPDRGPLAAEYPDVAALIWVLDTPEDEFLWAGVDDVQALGPDEG